MSCRSVCVCRKSFSLSDAKCIQTHKTHIWSTVSSFQSRNEACSVLWGSCAAYETSFTALLWEISGTSSVICRPPTSCTHSVIRSETCWLCTNVWETGQRLCSVGTQQRLRVWRLSTFSGSFQQVWFSLILGTTAFNLASSSLRTRI